tara:strand:- start:3783 stop:5282 length:1500 start_codon:yes stop_codon:yes gene_type:complete
MKILISISNTSGIVSFIKKLTNFYSEIEIIATSGTSKYLKENDVYSLEISDYIDFPEILNGRVKTLHPKIFGGILSKKNSKNHDKELKKYNISKIDMVICNLYQFEKIINSNKFNNEEAIENIDVGGASILRAAAKNYHDVIVISDPSDYESVLNSISGNTLNIDVRKKLASKVFNYLSDYDNKVAKYLENNKDTTIIKNEKLSKLRYGENPHQIGYIQKNESLKGIANSTLISGKEMSYNNYLDADIAFNATNSFKKNCVSIVKHSNICGLSINFNQLNAFKDAVSGDPVSAYGGILGFNSLLEEEVSCEIVKSYFEIVIAPEFSIKALEILKKRKNLRILQATYSAPNQLYYRSISGGMLAQSQNLDEKYDLKVMTQNFPTNQQLEDLKFAWKLCSFVKSNAIILAKNNTLLGMGAGQPNRVMSVKIAGEVAGEKSIDSVMASDAFFPFKDSIIKASDLGVKCIIQPGGSINDHKVIDEANKKGISMIFTNQRRFTH